MKKGNYKDIKGERNGRLEAIAFSCRRGNKTYWMFKCDCGNVVERAASGFLCGHITSCNCLRDEALKLGRKTKHGLSAHPTYNSWAAMVHRCGNPKHGSYDNYGAQGRFVCKHLKESPKHVADLIGLRPIGLSIDRIDNKGNYTCGQCDECLQAGYPFNIRWSDLETQNNNSGNCRFITLNGRTQTIAQWSREFGMTWSCLNYRIKHGLDPFKPVRTYTREVHFA